jgi:hypothetical protein
MIIFKQYLCMQVVCFGEGGVDALALGKQLNPKPLSCILISWVKKGQFEEGTWCKHNPPQ